MKVFEPATAHDRERQEQAKKLDGISVVLATYNGARFLRAQLDSILAQSLRPNEIIVSDDCSVDETVQIAEDYRFLTTLPIRIYVNAKNLGYSDNFLAACRLARYRYIAFADQDDVWHPEKLSKSYKALRDEDAVLCAHRVKLISEKGRFLGLTDQEISRSRCYDPRTLDPWGVFMGFTQMFDGRILDLIPEELRGPDSISFTKPLSHDRWIYFLATHFGRIVVLKDYLADYRQHERNTYGIKEKTLYSRFIDKCNEGPVRLTKFSDLAHYRVTMLLRAVEGTEGRAYVPGAVSRWRKIHTFCRRRVLIYSEDSLVGRVLKLLVNVVEGAYLPYLLGGLGPKRLLEDLSLGLFGTYFIDWDQK